MPRPRTGLGQGLEALVPSLRENSPGIASFNRPAAAPVLWEVAVLRRERKKRRCRFTIAASELLKEPQRRRIKTNTLLALGALGAAGWELTAIRGGKFYLKRIVSPPGD